MLKVTVYLCHQIIEIAKHIPEVGVQFVGPLHNLLRTASVLREAGKALIKLAYPTAPPPTSPVKVTLL